MPLDQIKVIIAERNGQELDSEEYELKAETVPFSAPGTHLSAHDNVKAALLAAGRFTANLGFPTGAWVATSGWATMGHLIYRGTNLQALPTFARAIIRCESGQTGSVRIFDVTNQTEIASITGFSETDNTLKTLSTPANVPTGEAIWEIQMKRETGNGNSKVWIYTVQIGN